MKNVELSDEHWRGSRTLSVLPRLKNIETVVVKQTDDNNALLLGSGHQYNWLNKSPEELEQPLQLYSMYQRSSSRSRCISFSVVSELSVQPLCHMQCAGIWVLVSLCAFSLLLTNLFSELHSAGLGYLNTKYDMKGREPRRSHGAHQRADRRVTPSSALIRKESKKWVRVVDSAP
ncbi:uncharacterized protein V6R79_019200 [Siganus canaliculatus]